MPASVTSPRHAESGLVAAGKQLKIAFARDDTRLDPRNARPSADPGPDSSLTEYGEEHICAHAQGAIVLDRHTCTLFHAVVGIVESPVLPGALVGAAKIIENREPQKRSRAQRGIRSLKIEQGQALSVVRPPEPDNLPAQSVAAGSNLDLDALVRVQPDADRRWALRAGRRCRKKRGEQKVGKSEQDHEPLASARPSHDVFSRHSPDVGPERQSEKAFGAPRSGPS